MARYIATRLLATIPVLLLVTTMTFIAIRIIPGDLAEIRLGDRATAQDVSQLRRELGLDRALHAQYGDWLGAVLTGDFGRSLQTGEPVTRALWRRVPVTLELGTLSILVSLVVALPMGVLSAVMRGRGLDHLLRVVAVLGQAIPSFWLAILLLTLSSIYLHWAPPFEYRSLLSDPRHNLTQFLLPVLILGYAQSATVMRLTRSAMLEVLQQDFIRTARAKGLDGLTVLRRHALRNALNPIVTIVGVQVGALIGGALIIEQIFSLPGVGKLTLQAIIGRDYSQIQFNTLVFAASVVLMNLLVDLSYVYFNPRVRSSLR